jgi:hypothetical protein
VKGGIWIIGEGVEDVGRLFAQGDLPRLLFRLSALAGGPAQFSYLPIALTEFRRQHAPRGGGPTRAGGVTRELRSAIQSVLDDHEPQAIVAVIDARLEDLDDYTIDVRDQIEPIARGAGVPLAIGLAIHEIEAWMLADPESRRAAFGIVDDARCKAIEDHPDPKTLWAELEGEAQRPQETPVLADDRRRTAWESLRPEVVVSACTRGFAPFHALVVDRFVPALVRR